MKIYTDGLFEKGSTHSVCEDYVFHGSFPVPFVVLCDGCSGSKHSDVGARLLAHAVPKVLNLMNSEEAFDLSAEEFAISVFQQARIACLALGLSKSSLSATLLVALYEPKTNNMRVIMVGDGILAIKTKNDNSVDVLQVDFSEDYPAYPGYFADHSLLDEYKKTMTKVDQKISFNWLIGALPLDAKVVSHPYIYEIVLPATSLDWLMLSSDGIDTFIEKELPQRTQDLKKLVLPSFIGIKQSQGTFVKRRIGKMLRSELDEFTHEDDLSVVGMSVVLEAGDENYNRG